MIQYLGENLRDEIRSVFIARSSCFLQLWWDKWAMRGHHSLPVSKWTNGFQSVSSSFSKELPDVFPDRFRSVVFLQLVSPWRKLSKAGFFGRLQWLPWLQRQCDNANVMKMEATSWWDVASLQCNVTVSHSVGTWCQKHSETMPLDVVGSWLSTSWSSCIWTLTSESSQSFQSTWLIIFAYAPLFALPLFSTSQYQNFPRSPVMMSYFTPELFGCCIGRMQKGSFRRSLSPQRSVLGWKKWKQQKNFYIFYPTKCSRRIGAQWNKNNSKCRRMSWTASGILGSKKN